MDIVQQLDAHLKDNNMYEQLRQILTQQEGKASVLDLAKLGRQPTLYRGKRYLQLQVKQGKGFLDTSSGEDVQDASLSVSAFFGDNR
jgi:hypothetical protein